MDKYDVLLLFIKYIGGVVSGFYGLYATLTDFHIEKGGKKFLSKKGYMGISLLVLSSVLALSSSALTDYKDNQEKHKAKDEKIKAAELEEKRRTEVLEREEQALSLLTKQLDKSEGISNDLNKALYEVTRNSVLTDKISNNLTGAVKSIHQTSETAKEVLRENKERIDYLELEISLVLSPEVIEYISEGNKLPEDLLRAVELYKERARLKSSYVMQWPIKHFGEAVARHRNLLQDILLNEWAMRLTLSHAGLNNSSVLSSMIYSRQNNDGIVSFEIDNTPLNWWRPMEVSTQTNLE